MAEKPFGGKFRFESGKVEDKPEPIKAGTLEDKGVIDKVDDVILQAVNREASDVHIEPGSATLSVRARVAGSLVEIATFPMDLHGKVVNRVKILSGMDITKSRIPQRGYFKVVVEERKIEIYSYVFPSVLGEKLVLKFHYRRAVSMALDHLGMFPTMLQPFRDAVLRSHGLILIVGPPGNGKTTTSYAILQILSSPEKEIMSVENVLKYEVPGMIQGRPDEAAEFPFSLGVKAMMDQEPDVALVGEVNEVDVARHIVHGAFSKRVVVARMSSNDTISAVTTMIDMGIQPFLLTAAINAILAQRLVRKVCGDCREPFVPPAELLEELGYRLPPNTQFVRGRGCDACAGSGYQGLMGIFELFLPNEEVKDLLIARKPASIVREAALKSGLIPLKKDGVQKAMKGYTSIEEVLNVL